jgi:hypothetical protein
MSTSNRLIDPAERERLIVQAKGERAEFMRTFMRNNSKRMMWTAGTMGALYLAVMSLHSTLFLHFMHVR